MSSSDLDKLTATLGRLADRLEGSPNQIAYLFDPKPDMTFEEVLMLLKTLNIRASNDQYMHENFPPALKRHFSPTVK